MDVRPRRVINETLVPRAVAGDPLARRAVIQQYGPLVWSICRRLAYDPDDSYQAIWEKVLKALDRFDPNGTASFSTWLASIAHRHLVDEHRRRVVRGVPVSPDELVAPPVEDDSRHVRLEAAIDQLPEGLKRVVILHHLHGVPLDTIARDEDAPVGTIKSRLHRARGILAQALAEES